MRSKTKTGVRLGLTSVLLSAAMLATGAFGAVAASAKEPVWIVNKAVLKAGIAKPYASEQASVKVLKVAGVEIQCTVESDEGSLVGGKPGKDTVTRAEYTKCAVTEPAGHECKVREPIALNAAALSPIRSTLVWEAATGGKVLDLLQPKENSKTFVSITIEGCKGGGTEFYNGTHEVTEEVLSEVWNGKSEPVNALATPPEEATVGYLNFRCPPLLEYWTGDEPSRVKHTIKQLNFIGLAAEYCEKTKIELKSKEAFGVTAE